MQRRRRSNWRTLGTVLVVALVVISAGCAGFGGTGETEGTTENTADGGDDPGSTVTGDDDGGNSGDRDGGNGAGPTDDTTTDDRDENPPIDESNKHDPDVTDRGDLRIVIDGEELELAGEGRIDDDFWFALNPETAWFSASETDRTLAEALTAIGVETDGETLTNDGETYADADEGYSLHIRVNGNEVDPTAHTLEDGDEVWVIVEPDFYDVDHLDIYVTESEQHLHGSLEVIVDGEAVNFSQSQYQGANGGSFFHFHDGNGDRWHGHSWALTLAEAVSVFTGIDVSDEAVVFDGERYDLDDSEYSVTVAVDGEPVTPSEYYVKDGDDISVVIETGV